MLTRRLNDVPLHGAANLSIFSREGVACQNCALKYSGNISRYDCNIDTIDEQKP